MFAKDLEDEHSSGERLATPRLVLRTPAVADVPALVSLANNANIAENLMSMPHPYGEENAEAWIRKSRTRLPDQRAFLICLREPSEQPIGACGWSLVDGLDLPQVGYWVGEPFWGSGFATEAAQTLIDNAFATSKLDMLGCGCRVTNLASRRVIEKCGFQYDGLGMVHSLARGGTMPILKYRMDRRTWISLKAWSAA
ncbi:MAG: GNAT family N-acetyltransferase [Pseudomonadota bacterium]